MSHKEVTDKHKEVTYESQEKKSQKEIKGMSHNKVTEMSHRIESQK